MPRSMTSPAAAIVDFFRKASFETADLVMDLSKAALRERKQKSAAAKERATTPPAKPAPAAKNAKPVAAVAKKKAKKSVKSKSHKATRVKANGEDTVGPLVADSNPAQHVPEPELTPA